MLEQPDTEERSGFAIVSLKLALSQEARASLAAVRVAQESAQKRARRQTMETRLGVALLLGAAALGAVASAPRLARWRQSRAQAANAVRPSPLAPERAAAAATAHAAPPAVAVQRVSADEPARAAPPAVAVQRVSADEPTRAAPPAPAAAAPIVAPAKATDSGVPAEGCDTSTRRGLWRRSPEACARAFAADPKNASLALAVAQAEHAHARFDEAAQWAKRALALDPSAAEAYVIIARAEVANGRDEEARAAYQRYLELAPRGWHKAEARAALRRAFSSR
ncbi:MAG TPA: hypothetical protein VLA79_14225 [Polyangia bacterium]|nr:hypothetical protein [Polyangia bacterium]